MRFNSYAEWRADKVVRALELAWRRSGKTGPHPGLDYRPYIGKTPQEAFREAHARGTVNDLQLTLALCKVWEPKPKSRRPRRRRPEAVEGVIL